MPRGLSISMLSVLQGDATDLSLCWKVTRTGHPAQGFTACPVAIVYDGLTYEPSTALTPSAIRTEAGSGVDNMDVVGFLESEAIRARDLLAGRYDQAEVEVFLVSRSNLGAGRIVVMAGRIGEAELEGDRFKSELRSWLQHASAKPQRRANTTCDVKEFGDARCGKSLTGLRWTATVTSVDSRRVFACSSLVGRTEAMAYGDVLMQSGANEGVRRMVKTFTSGTGQIELQEPLPLAIEVGDGLQLTAGCDRSFAACKAYNNVLNFRGFPHMPGEDRTIRVQPTD